MNICQASLKAVVIVAQPFMIKAHQVEDGGIEIVDFDGIHRGLEAELVALTEAESLLYAGARQEAGECIRVVVAASAITLQEGHPAKLGGPDNECVLKQATTLHVGNKSSCRLIHDLRLHRVCLKNIRVRIPIGDAVATGGITAVEELNHADSLLDQAARQDAVLGIFAFQFCSSIGAVFPCGWIQAHP